MGAKIFEVLGCRLDRGFGFLARMSAMFERSSVRDSGRVGMHMLRAEGLISGIAPMLSRSLLSALDMDALSVLLRLVAIGCGCCRNDL